MSAFGDYAEYYDLLYRDKDYPGEAQFVLDRLRQHGLAAASTLLDLGVGSARHAEQIVRQGYALHGVDMSAGMLRLAEQRGRALPQIHAQALTLQQGDVRTVRVPRTFDAVISLFHVLSYQVTDADVSSMLRTVRAHLAPGSLALCDFWWGKGVEHEPPQPRTRTVENDAVAVERRTRPVWRHDLHIVEVNFDVEVTFKNGARAPSLITETHPMRYFYAAEIEVLMSSADLDVVEMGEWMTAAPLRDDSFNAYVVVRAR